MKESRCRFCKTQIFAGVECVACYRQRMIPCRTCRTSSGKVTARYRTEDCPECHGERFLLREAPPSLPATDVKRGADD
jgi:hypothetical protein